MLLGRSLTVALFAVGGCNAISGVGDYREVPSPGADAPAKRPEPSVLCEQTCDGEGVSCCQEKAIAPGWNYPPGCASGCSTCFIDGKCPAGFGTWECDDPSDCKTAPDTICCANADVRDLSKFANSMCLSHCDSSPDAYLCDPGDPTDGNGCPPDRRRCVGDPRLPPGYGLCAP